MAASINNPAWLDWMARLTGETSRQTLAATFPADRYYCLLDELPWHLVPQTARAHFREQKHGEQPLFLNSNCFVSEASSLPEELSGNEDIVSGFALQGTIAWVRSHASGALVPFWLGPELEALLRSLQDGKGAVPASIPANSKALLSSAGILVPEEVDLVRDSGEEKFRAAAAKFKRTGYAPLAELIHPFHVAALRRYYRQLVRTGVAKLGDRQSDRRYVAYNEPVARYFHQQLAPALSIAAGEKLRPSYVYLASYLGGAELKKHVDRPQCEFSVTLCLDFSPEPELATPWPIHLETPGGTVDVYQSLGDGLVYRGTTLPHYRRPLGNNKTSTSIFFHYVGSDFDGPLE
jgi:hypothetical protein